MTRVWQISICFSTMHLSWTHVAILAAFLHSRISVQITVLTVLIKSIIWYLSYSTITITDYIMTRSYGIFVCFAFTPSTHQVVVIIVYPILLSKCPETDIFLWRLMCQTHRIHGTGIFTYMKTIQINEIHGSVNIRPRPMGIRHGKVKRSLHLFTEFFEQMCFGKTAAHLE